MTRLWLIRLGKHGEKEGHAIKTGQLLTGWQVGDLTKATNLEEIRKIVESSYPEKKSGTQQNWAVQLNLLRNHIQKDDLIIIPLKTSQGEIAIGRDSGIYKHLDYHPTREVKWEKTNISRDVIKQDLLYSLGASGTVCEIKRNNAVARIEEVLKSGFDPSDSKLVYSTTNSDEFLEEPAEPLIDLAENSRDQIERKISSTFIGHEFTYLVDAVLKAEGYVTHVSPPGPDGGYDIVAGRGSLGFDAPRLVVQVKSGNIKIDHPTLQSLKGCIHEAGADQGLIVSWGGFKQTVLKEINKQYFQVRFWGRSELVEAIFNVYDKLPEKIRTELPLRKIWTLVPEEDDEST